MTVQITNPYQYFTDAAGDQLNSGNIYIGEANLDPVTNPVATFWDVALSIPAAQPIRTAGGYPVNAGSPGQIFTAAAYSITVKDKNGVLVYTSAEEQTLTGALSGTGSGEGSDLVGWTGNTGKTVTDALGYITVTPEQYGAIGDGLTNDTVAVAAAVATGKPVVGNGTYLLTALDPTMYNLTGFGWFKVGTVLVPTGDVQAAVALNVPSIFATVYAANDYLSYRRLNAVATITLPAGTVGGAGGDYTTSIMPSHPDGRNIAIEGASAATTTIEFDFTGKEASGDAALDARGSSIALGSIDKITLDGGCRSATSWRGRTGGDPASNAGDPTDPSGIKARDGATIVCGTDVIVTDMPRNGVLTFNGGDIIADSITVTGCGSDGIVASTSGSTLADDSTSIGNYGFGYYCDYGGNLWANDTEASATLKRNGVGGTGYGSTHGAVLYAKNAVSFGNDGDGANILNAVAHMDGAVLGKSGDQNAGHGLRCQNSGRVYAPVLTTSYNDLNGMIVGKGGGVFGSTLIASFNTVDGLFVGPGGELAFAVTGTVSSNGAVGVNGTSGASIEIQTLTADSNVSHGVFLNGGGTNFTCDLVTSIDSNGGWGVRALYSSVANLGTTSVAGVITGNALGATSPASDATTGQADSFIYAQA